MDRGVYPAGVRRYRHDQKRRQSTVLESMGLSLQSRVRSGTGQLKLQEIQSMTQACRPRFLKSL
jgi:hypothetical protein